MKKHCTLIVFFACMSVSRGQTPFDPAAASPFLSPGDAPANQTISLAALRHKIPAKALAAFQRALKLAHRHEWGQGARELEASVALDPDFADAHSNLGIHYLELDRADDAVTELRRAIALDSRVSSYHANLAVAYLRRHESSQAKTEAETAVALDSANTRAQYMLGFLLAQNPDDRASAQRHLSFAASEFPYAHLMLMVLYRRAGDETLATREFQRYQKAVTKVTN